MRDFSDKPYRYFAPRRRRYAVWLLSLLNQHIGLPRTNRIVEVRVSGDTEILRQRSAETRILFTPNHPTHSDPMIYLEALRQTQLSSQIMAAYDVFLRNKLTGWVMQRMGAFSVDREGSDTQAMKQARATLEAGVHGLTVFPEGNVYLQNDRVTPFMEGAAFLGLRSLKNLDSSAQLWFVPVSIKASYCEDVREVVRSRLSHIADDLKLDCSVLNSPLELIRSIGRAALQRNLQARGMQFPEADSIADMISKTAECVVQQLETKMGITPKPKHALIERIRRARQDIHAIRIDESRSIDHAAARMWADEAILTMRIASYLPDYVANHPSIDRIAETTEKIEEDLYQKTVPPYGNRIAYVHFGDVIDCQPYFEAYVAKSRSAIGELTSACEGGVQAGLDQINTDNNLTGAQLWTTLG